ncbi:hypothetical protein HNP31_001668 [Acinetobacter johnsonii]|uniref:hypothetical protein n=1 Tax=Acinetobacter johnsonii TaxID=40214 RepID=UPI001613FF48|nr:hypothetical protein [Acinetobacter johnsonii]MBB4809951.1 hypothetical protein [Acinetobacter johnsonii]
MRSALDWLQQEIITRFQQLWSWSKHHFGWTLFISLIFNLLVFICFPSSWIPTQTQSKTFDEITVEVGKGRISTLKFKQQHHLWIANCALMGGPIETLCDQSSHRHQFTAKQVELYYLERIFWNLKNTKKEVFIQQITLANPRLQHLDITYSSTAADFEQWKKHQLAPLYVIRTLISLNLLWLLTIVGLKIKAWPQLKQ